VRKAGSVAKVERPPVGRRALLVDVGPISRPFSCDGRCAVADQQ
jgi:hypothetical protein